MGTRSTTTIYENGEPLLTFYRQMDGYPSGHGQELVDFLKGIEMVNGIQMGGDPPKLQQANGAGCLAAQILTHFKTGVINHTYGEGGMKIREGDNIGGIYVVPLGQTEQYNYGVKVNKHNKISGISIITGEKQDGMVVHYSLDEYDGKAIEEAE